MTFLAGGFARGFSPFVPRMLEGQLIVGDRLVHQGIERSSASSHGTSFLNFRFESTEEHDTFCFVVKCQGRSVRLKFLGVRGSRAGLIQGAEAVLGFGFESAVTVDVDERLFEGRVIVTERMIGIGCNIISPGKRFVLETRNGEENTTFVVAVRVGTDRKDERDLRHEVLEFRRLSREHFRWRHLGVG